MNTLEQDKTIRRERAQEKAQKTYRYGDPPVCTLIRTLN